MLAAAKQTNSPSMYKGFLEHAIDEYKHSKIFLELCNSEARGETNIPSTQDVKDMGYVHKEKPLYQKLGKEKFGVFVAVHERLAIKEFVRLRKYLKQHSPTIGKVIEDEESHFHTLLIDEHRHSQLARQWVFKHIAFAKIGIYSLYFFSQAKYRKLHGRVQFLTANIFNKIFVPFTIASLFLINLINKPSTFNVKESGISESML